MARPIGIGIAFDRDFRNQHAKSGYKGLFITEKRGYLENIRHALLTITMLENRLYQLRKRVDSAVK